MDNSSEERSIYARLVFFLNQVRIFFHPSNSGSWIDGLSIFLASLIMELNRRVAKRTIHCCLSPWLLIVPVVSPFHFLFLICLSHVNLLLMWAIPDFHHYMTEQKEGHRFSQHKLSPERLRELIDLLLPLCMNLIFSASEKVMQRGCRAITRLSRAPSLNSFSHFIAIEITRCPHPMVPDDLHSLPFLFAIDQRRV